MGGCGWRAELGTVQYEREISMAFDDGLTATAAVTSGNGFVVALLSR